MKNILLIYGGKSTEHDVSIITAMQFMEKIACDDFNLHLCYLSRENKFYMGEDLQLFDSYRNFDKTRFSEVIFIPGDKGVYKLIKNKKVKKLFDVDFIFNCCHGGVGEGGELSGYYAMSGIILSSASPASLAVCYDKVLTKKVAESSEIPVIPYIVITHEMWKNNREIAASAVSSFGYPVIVKPARQGSSVGVCLAKNEDELYGAMRLALEFDNKIVIERAIMDKREFNVSCISTIDGPIISDIEEVYINGIMSFSDKYSGGKKGFNIASAPFSELSRDYPAKLNKKMTAYIKNLSRKIFLAFELFGVVRFDFIMDNQSDTIYLSEINTIPGSMSDYFWSKFDMKSTIMSSAIKQASEREVIKGDYDVHLL